jgi:class 3 adenylate cyclase/tetratricopeptide (TPR) repeat protein
MQCLSCHTDNPPANRFCDQCGELLEARCPQCTTVLRAGARFCGGCGHRLVSFSAPAPATPREGAAPGSTTASGSPVSPAARPIAAYTPKHLADKVLKARSAIEGERRQVTVLFADIAGFTALAEGLDPEEVHQIVDRCFEAITAEVHRFEGTINQYTGDGVMALFGAPIAHEDGARRAVHAALGIQRAIRDLSREIEARQGPAIRMRVGLNTGPVVVGRIGDDLRMDYTAVGDTTNVAARIQQAARPGSVLVSESTLRAIGGFFETLDLGEQDVKGHAPVRAHEVLRPRGRRSRLDAAVERGLTPLVGRARELDILRERFREARAGRGQVVFVAGEAGIGKSRLLLEFRRGLAEAGEDATWLEGQCVSFGQAIPFLPIVDQLRRNFGIEELDGEPEIIAKIEHGMRRMGGLDAQIPYIRYLLAVDPGDPKVAAIDAAARRARILEAVRALSLVGARIRPLILVFEDLHWVDASSEEYLTSLMDAVASAPILLVLTYRIGYAPPFGSRSFYTTVTLHTLSDDDALAMAGGVLGSADFPRELREALTAKAEGVPLYVEEVAKTLLDVGVLRREDGGYRLVRRLDEAGVPDTIQGIIMARLDRLGEDGKRTVQLASVIGRQFLKRLLARIAGLTHELDGLLRELKTLEIVYELGLLPEPAYIFKHAVIQDVAYQSLLVQRRRDLHRAVGQAIEELYADRLADHYEELAHHFAQGEAWGKAFEYMVRSGDKARDTYANEAALAHYARAIEVAPRVVPELPLATVLDVYQRRGRVQVVMAKNNEAIEGLETMLALARAAGDRRLEGEALADLAFTHGFTFLWEHQPVAARYADEAVAIGREIGDDRLLAKALSTRASVHSSYGELDQAVPLIEESVRVGEPLGSPELYLVGLFFLGHFHNWQGDFHRAIEIQRRVAREAQTVHDEFNEGLGLWCLGQAHIGCGLYAEARAVLDDVLVKSRERKSHFHIGRITNSLGWLHQELGDFHSALEFNREAAALAQQHRIGNIEVSAQLDIATSLARRGELEAALSLFEEMVGRVEKGLGSHRWRWDMRVSLGIAESLLALGRPGDALAWIDRAAATARSTGSAKYLGKCHALRGDLAILGRRWDNAVAELGEALAIGRRIEYPTLTWQTAHLLARAQAAAGRVEEAAGTARVAVETIDLVAARSPEESLRRTFTEWTRVQTAREDLEQILR